MAALQKSFLKCSPLYIGDGEGRGQFSLHISQKSIINGIRLDDEMGKKNGIKLEKSSKINGAGLVKEVKIWGKNR